MKIKSKKLRFSKGYSHIFCLSYTLEKKRRYPSPLDEQKSKTGKKTKNNNTETIRRKKKNSEENEGRRRRRRPYLLPHLVDTSKFPHQKKKLLIHPPTHHDLPPTPLRKRKKKQKIFSTKFFGFEAHLFFHPSWPLAFGCFLAHLLRWGLLFGQISILQTQQKTPDKRKKKACG